MIRDTIELLSVDLLDRKRPLVEAFERLAAELELGIGWHYRLDLTWAADLLSGLPTGSVVLDAGAGFGLMQWFLASHGLEVLSVDRNPRLEVSRPIADRYAVVPYAPGDTTSTVPRLRDFLPPRSVRRWHTFPAKLTATLRRKQRQGRRRAGKVYFHHSDLVRLERVPDESVDAVVAISSLEHNQPDRLKKVVAELMRVTRRGGFLAATVGAARDADWLHEPSRGWCYSEASLRSLFELDAGCESNWREFDGLYAALRDCDELREKLDPYYRQPGSHGMPRGVWDPEYHVAGVIKVRDDHGT